MLQMLKIVKNFYKICFNKSVPYSDYVNGRKPAYWYRHGRNDKIQRDAFVNASPWIHYFWYYHHIIVRLAMLSGAL